MGTASPLEQQTLFWGFPVHPSTLPCTYQGHRAGGHLNTYNFRQYQQQISTNETCAQSGTGQAHRLPKSRRFPLQCPIFPCATQQQPRNPFTPITNTEKGRFLYSPSTNTGQSRERRLCSRQAPSCSSYPGCRAVCCCFQEMALPSLRRWQRRLLGPEGRSGPSEGCGMGQGGSLCPTASPHPQAGLTSWH